MKIIVTRIIVALLFVCIFTGCGKEAPTLSYSVITNRCTEIANESDLLYTAGGDVQDSIIQCRFVANPDITKEEATKIVDSLFIMDFTEVMLSEIGSHGDYSKHTQLGSTYDLRDHYNTKVLFVDRDENVLFTVRTYRWFSFLPFWS